MTPPRRACQFAAIAVALLIGATAQAQRQRGTSDTTAVPKVLAEALIAPGFEILSSFFGDGARMKPEVVVGKLPTSMERRLPVPSGVHVLGGLNSRTFGIAVLRTSLPTDSAIGAFRRALLQRGWTAPSGSLASFGGFRPAATGPDNDEILLCSDGASMSIGATREKAETRIQATFSEHSFNQCIVASGKLDPKMQPRYPSLGNPPGTGSGSRLECDAQGRNTVGSTVLTGVTDVGRVLDHYDRELVDSGYTRKPLATETRTWTRPDSAGALAEVTLTARIVSTTPSCIEVTMQYKGPSR